MLVERYGDNRQGNVRRGGGREEERGHAAIMFGGGSARESPPLQGHREMETLKRRPEERFEPVARKSKYKMNARQKAEAQEEHMARIAAQENQAEERLREEEAKRQQMAQWWQAAYGRPHVAAVPSLGVHPWQQQSNAASNMRVAAYYQYQSQLHPSMSIIAPDSSSDIWLGDAYAVYGSLPPPSMHMPSMLYGNPQVVYSGVSSNVAPAQCAAPVTAGPAVTPVGFKDAPLRELF